MNKRLLLLICSLFFGIGISAQTTRPFPQENVTVNVVEGRAWLTVEDDPNMEWLQVYVGTPNFVLIHLDWYKKTTMSCNGLTCQFMLDYYVQNGDFVVYVQPWGFGHYSDQGLSGWFGPIPFSFYQDQPDPVQMLSVTMNGNSAHLTWSSSNNASFYQVWFGTLTPFNPLSQNWYTAETVGCKSGGTCSLTLTLNLNYGSTYNWYVQAWGPGGFSIGGIADSGWYEGPKVVIGSDEVFGLGGQVDSFSYFNLMQQAGMTWVKRQVRYGQEIQSDTTQPLIDDAKNKNIQLLLSIIGSKEQLAANRDLFIQDYATFAGEVAARMDAGGAIEIWNEPNLEREWPQGQISGSNYTDLLRAAYTAIKASNPAIMVISAAPGPTGVNIEGLVVSDDNFINQMKAAGAANYLDCVGIHYNEGIISPTLTSGDPRGNSNHYSRYYWGMVNLYNSVFPSKPLCFTELGYVTAEGHGPLPPGFEWAVNTTVAHQAQWLAEAAQQSRGDPRVRLMIVWNVDFTRYDSDPMAGYAIVRPGGVCPACATLGAVMSTTN